MRKPKVVVVGAGPSGGATALALARTGTAEVVLLDKSKYPRIKVCGSGLSPWALKQLKKMELLETLEPLHAEIRGMQAKGPGGGELNLRGGKGAWVVPRVEFDQTIAMEAVKFGAELRPETKVTSLLHDAAGRVKGVQTKSGDIEADLVVSATGSPSRLSTDTRPRYGIRTIMGWWKDTKCPSDECVMIWDRRLDGYYAWAFPEPNGVVNIGLTIPEEAEHTSRLKALFQDLLEEHWGLDLKDATQIGKWMGHPATLTTRVGDMAHERVMYVGEAARLVSPATVEGISFAMESGNYAAEFIRRHFDLERGYSRTACQLYRTGTARRMLPKFLAAEGFVRFMRSEPARRLGHRMVSGRVNQAFANAVSSFLGD